MKVAPSIPNAIEATSRIVGMRDSTKTSSIS
jgi:hypothetical protein